MKTATRAIAAAVFVFILGSVLPARANGPYQIKGGAVLVTGVTRPVMERSGCNPAHPANGVDAYLFDVSNLAGQINRVLKWKTSVSQAYPYLGITFYNSGCDYIAAKTPIAASPYTLNVPAGSKWALVEAFQTAQVEFTLT